MTVYFISGLGADKRVFQNLQLPAHYTPYYIEWTKNKPGETLAEYARRLAAAIDTTQSFVLIGMSFGGMLAVEISRFLHPEQTILISSVARRSELPFYFRMLKWMPLHKVLPYYLLKHPTWLTYRVFGIKTKKDKKLFDRILYDTDVSFLRWALHAVITWPRRDVPSRVVRIHGSRDGILPLRYVKADFVVERGGHFMVYNRAKEVSAIVRRLLENEAGDRK